MVFFALNLVSFCCQKVPVNIESTREHTSKHARELRKLRVKKYNFFARERGKVSVKMTYKVHVNELPCP